MISVPWIYMTLNRYERFFADLKELFVTSRKKMTRLAFQLIVVVFLIGSYPANADSPVTSTDFSRAYSDEEILQKALLAEGTLNENLMSYLYQGSHPIDIRLAVINQLSWDYNGKNNYQLFLEYCFKRSGISSEDKLLRKAKGDLLICLAYLKAMDNYFDVTKAYELSKMAKKKGKRSYSIHLIAGIIEGQYMFDSDWCGVFKATEKVRINKKLKTDIRSEAINIIFNYMDLYADSCT